jgi:ring-1,2-phenylacetyl-CoA epoxidase subunit PaaD
VLRGKRKTLNPALDQQRQPSDALLLEAVNALPDPEIPVISLGDLGIVRGLHREQGICVVSITPTYSGCPATETIRDDILALLKARGEAQAKVVIALSPAWTTDWISEEGRNKLKAFGIAPPLRCLNKPGSIEDNVSALGGEHAYRVFPLKRMTTLARVQCPRCESEAIESISEFGSTPCKAIYRCLACREPFDYFKPY